LEKQNFPALPKDHAIISLSKYNGKGKYDILNANQC
jgi:hypothetical protein